MKLSSYDPSKKYVDINGKVSKDKWQSMFRYLARYVDILKSDGTYEPLINYHNTLLSRLEIIVAKKARI